MAKKNQKVQKQLEQQPTPHPTAPATLLELSDEEMQQITGGFNPQPEPPGKTPDSTGADGLPVVIAN